MGQPVKANGRSIVHKGHGQTHTCAPPDVCKTPSPGGPVPIPYVNLAMDSDLANGANSVRIEGNPVANVSSKLSTSTGDEPGTAGGGILSSKTKGTATWKFGSLDVKAEGKMVVRFSDSAFHNGNSFNSAFVNMGGTGLAYGDDMRVRYCELCGQGPEEHRILETPNSADLCRQLITLLRDRFNAAPENPARPGGECKGRYHRRQGRIYKGYMVGLMVCPCGRRFAAKSGGDMPGFTDCVAAVGATYVQGGGANGLATPAQMATANTSGRATAGRKLRYITARMDALQEMNQNREPGYNPPGNCAGAKLVACSGHKPVQMTEAFSLVRNAPFTYNVLTTELPNASPTWLREILRNRLAQDIPQTYTGDDSIASCHTCQDLVYLAMCPERRCG
jgi:Domain of unknown function (DUF4150)